MSVFDKLAYHFSAVHLRHVCRKMGYFWRYSVRNKKHIRLAVVGTTSSGKSFLLQDILTSLRSMAGIFNPLETTLQHYKDFGNYSPDEGGGEGGTPLYACRQGNHYGSSVKHNNNVGDRYDMDFLNIPGEIFATPRTGMSRLKAYTNLRDKLRKTGRSFTATLWMADTGEQVWIVEPVSGSAPTNADRVAVSPTNPKTLVTSFKSWEQIFSDLNIRHFKPVKGSSKRISGTTLLRHFFEYDTDSVIRSIQEWIRSSSVADLGFDAQDFEANAYDRGFVFFHYCSMATDIVICDRIFTSDQPSDEMSFGDLTKGLDSFIDDCSESEQLHVYLAFRNVDFIMYPREENYQLLNKQTLRDMSPDKRRNAIYSLFAYAIQHYLDGNLAVGREELSDFIGMPPEKIAASETTAAVSPENVSFDVAQLAEALLDVTGGSGYLKKDTPDLRAHINSRLGGDDGHAFRMLLKKTKMKMGKDNNAVEKIVPHVYFSCTPITSEYDIYQNFNLEDGRPAPDFEKVINGKKYRFHLQNSNVCFGSYQLAMDILSQHQLGNFMVGDLLRIMQGNV